MKTRFTTLLFAIAAVFIGLEYVHGDTVGTGKPGTVTVMIKELKYSPEVITVKPGTLIKWVNEDNMPHDVTSGVSLTGRAARNVENPKEHDGKFKSGLFSKRKKFKLRLTEKGEYPYYCNIHPFMVGKIVVE